MSDATAIRGGAGEFEAAVIAAVIERTAREESATEAADPDRRGVALSAWVRALRPEDPAFPREALRPD